MKANTFFISPTNNYSPSPRPRPPPSPAKLPARRENFCKKNPTTRAVFSGRRIKSTLSGINPCFGPRAANSGECCDQCQADPTCIAWTFTQALDCREHGARDGPRTGACYLIETYTGSYEPIQWLEYTSGRAIK